MLPTRSVQVLRRQRGPVVGVLNPFFPGLVQRVGVPSPAPVGQSGGWSVQVLLPPDAVQRLGADPSRLPDTRPLAGVDRSCQRTEGAERLIPLRSQTRPRRLRVLLAAPQPEPKPDRGRVVPANVNNHSVREVMNRNNTASRRLPSSGYICGAADALRPALALPPEQIASSGTPYHAAAWLPNHGSHRRCRHLHRPVIPQRQAERSLLPRGFPRPGPWSRDRRASCVRRILPTRLSAKSSPGRTVPCASTPIRRSE